jgi:hypothetical protein
MSADLGPRDFVLKVANRRRLDEKLTALLTPHGFARHDDPVTSSITYGHAQTLTAVTLGTFEVYVDFLVPTDNGEDVRVVRVGEVQPIVLDHTAPTLAHLALTLHQNTQLRRGGAA